MSTQELAHTSSLKVADELSPATLQQITTGEVDVIWHRGFYGRDLCKAALPAITAACNAASYTLTSDLQSVGVSVGEAAESELNHARYLAGALATTRSIRDEVFAGQLSPTDRLRLLLDEYWPRGASVARDQSRERQMLPGILRRWASGGHANPHIDQTETAVLGHLGVKRRIGTNVYLELPGNGGEIEFWSRISQAGYEQIRRPDYGLDRDRLGPPAFSILPGQGDLVMFDAAVIHGVAGVSVGSRVTAACFVGYVDPDQPLLLFA